MSGLKRNIRDFFIITRSQRNGIIFLLILLFFLILLNISLPVLVRHQPPPDPALFAEKVNRFFITSKSIQTVGDSLKPFPFDPNTVTYEALLQLGLSARQAEMIIRYRNAGGQFRKPEDLAKIYSISDEEYQLLKPYIVIADSREKSSQDKKSPAASGLQPFPFDPNTIDSAAMHAMGLKPHQIRNILSYREKGGKFRTKNDFSKLYAITAEDFALLEKYILLPSQDTLKEAKPAAPPKIIEINSADTNDLIALKGIGSVLARRIINYRNKLGGFYDKAQLLEVFGMDTARLALISPYIEVDQSLIRKMNLNRTPYREMLAHPYLENYIVKAIFDYKEVHGRFREVSELRNIPLIYPQLYTKLEHYFTTENP